MSNELIRQNLKFRVTRNTKTRRFNLEDLGYDGHMIRFGEEYSELFERDLVAAATNEEFERVCNKWLYGETTI
jgi:hypothetical protein